MAGRYNTSFDEGRQMNITVTFKADGSVLRGAEARN